MKFEYGNERFLVKTAASLQELTEVQKFRYEIFSREMGLRRPDGLDADYFDPFCDHLYVLDKARDRIVGVYRLLPGERARDAQSFYCESEFELSRLPTPRHRILELGRSCVHPDYRNGAVIQLLWLAISAYLDEDAFDLLVGAVSVPESRDAVVEKMAAYFSHNTAAPLAYQMEVKPKYQLPGAYPTLMHYRRMSKPGDLSAHRYLPPLLKGYLNLGAWVASPPAWDPAFGCFDFLTLLHRDEINPVYLKRFRRMRATQTVEAMESHGVSE